MLEVERLCDRVIIMKRGKIEDATVRTSIMARATTRHSGASVLDVARGAAAGGVVSETPASRDFAASHPCDGAALLVFDVVVVAAAAGTVYWPALRSSLGAFWQNYISQTSGFFARAGGTPDGA